MNLVIDIVLILSTLLSLYVVVIMTKTNIKFRERMELGGRIFIIITDVCYIFTVLYSISTLAVTVVDLTRYEQFDLITALALFLGSACLWLLLLIRGLQNKGISVMFDRGNALRDSRNKLMVNVSHEIRTPMNSIIGLSEVILRRDDIPEDVREDVNNISVASSLLLGVVNNLIDFTKVEANQMEIIETEYNTKSFLDEIASRANSMLKGSQVEFLTDIDTRLPSRLIGDDVRLIQAISNVISNSCKYTHVGVVTFHVNGIKEKDNIRLKFVIEDTGIGMTQKQKEKLFDYSSDEMIRNPKNGQLISETSLSNRDENFEDNHSKGPGLGLIITKNIIEKMGGKITFNSEEGRGTSVTIEVDQKIAIDTEIGDLSNSLTKKKKNYWFTAPVAKVLVVDDNIVNLFVSKELLLNYEIDVTTAQSGAECLALVNNNYYDLIFMDYVMPEMDGHETLINLRKRQNEFAKKIPVVALTAMVTNSGAKMYIDEGFQGYLSKPINVDDLEEQLIRLLPDEYIVRKNKVEDDDEAIEDKLWYKRICSILTGVNIKQGLLYSNNDYNSYLTLLKVIYNDSYTQLAKLNTYKTKIDLNDFRVTVHALKSVTASVGADDISAVCKDLEIHAKEGNTRYIMDNISKLITMFDEFLRKVDTLLQRENEMMVRGFNEPKRDISDDELDKILNKILIALDDFNIDETEELLKELECVNLDYNRAKAIENAAEILQLFKYDEVKNVIKKAFDK